MQRMSFELHPDTEEVLWGPDPKGIWINVNDVRRKLKEIFKNGRHYYDIENDLNKILEGLE